MQAHQTPDQHKVLRYSVNPNLAGLDPTQKHLHWAVPGSSKSQGPMYIPSPFDTNEKPRVAAPTIKRDRTTEHKLKLDFNSPEQRDAMYAAMGSKRRAYGRGRDGDASPVMSEHDAPPSMDDVPPTTSTRRRTESTAPPPRFSSSPPPAAPPQPFPAATADTPTPTPTPSTPAPAAAPAPPTFASAAASLPISSSPVAAPAAAAAAAAGENRLDMWVTAVGVPAGGVAQLVEVLEATFGRVVDRMEGAGNVTHFRFQSARDAHRCVGMGYVYVGRRRVVGLARCRAESVVARKCASIAAAAGGGGGGSRRRTAEEAFGGAAAAAVFGGGRSAVCRAGADKGTVLSRLAEVVSHKLWGKLE